MHANSLRDFKSKLSEKNPEFALLRDVADAHKHVKISRTDRNITHADQTQARIIGFGEAEYGAESYCDEKQIVVEDDNGKIRRFSLVIVAVNNMWRTLIFQNKILDKKP